MPSIIRFAGNVLWILVSIYLKSVIRSLTYVKFSLMEAGYLIENEIVYRDQLFGETVTDKYKSGIGQNQI